MALPPSIQLINVKPRKLADYAVFTPSLLESIISLAVDLRDKKIIQVNATSVGGGVAEMLSSLIPLEQNAGLNSNWYVIPPDNNFFEITKSLHNYLQGKEGTLTPEHKEIYLKHNQLIAKQLDTLEADILVIHDPQPLAAINFMKKKPKATIWRCHIDTSHPNSEVWQFLVPYINQYDHMIFTMQDFAHSEISAQKVSCFTPVIDPLSIKNLPLEKDLATQMLSQLGLNMNAPLVTQVSRLDPWKDPKGVIDAFVLAQREIPNLQLAFVAQMADDDPEGVRIAEEVRDYAKGKSNIFFFINLKDNDKMVNAFQTASTIILQKSSREGFGLTVTEAMYKGAIVIGGNVGGIKLQIQDGVNGFLVNSIEETAEKINYVINNPEKMPQLSNAAHQTVMTKFLMPHLLYNELSLFHKFLAGYK